ncbi:MAG: hypothetical protein ACLGIZ_15305 [Acidimicrobiia bacterium]|jgi:hypothetical protein
MTAKNKRSSGRVTPKGTKNPTKTTKRERPGLPDATGDKVSGTPPHELAGKAGKQSGKVNRPASHNRGNR